MRWGKAQLAQSLWRPCGKCYPTATRHVTRVRIRVAWTPQPQHNPLATAPKTSLGAHKRAPGTHGGPECSRCEKQFGDEHPEPDSGARNPQVANRSVIGKYESPPSRCKVEYFCELCSDDQKRQQVAISRLCEVLEVTFKALEKPIYEKYIDKGLYSKAKLEMTQIKPHLSTLICKDRKLYESAG